jgi:peptidoglycan/xylan/chitin deacetylase (PgdA/CDA1 family)
VPATFFVLGKNGQAHPELLRRMVNEGHEIGNHTFTHPNLGEIPGRITMLELNATQRLIESITGRSTVLFRPPYFGDAEADTPEEVEPAIIARDLGYIMVGLRIDPDDWEPGVTPDEIVKRRSSGPKTRTRTPAGRWSVARLGRKSASHAGGAAANHSRTARSRLQVCAGFDPGWLDA